MADDYEQTLTVLDECFVFKIPPRTSSEGHKASNWDLEHHIWKGRCRVTAQGEVACVRLEAESGQLFAMCKVDSNEQGTPAVEPVLDSSRYYVITLVNERSGRKHFLGLGFNDRGLSFDFKAALQDHKKYIQQMAELKKNPRQYQDLDLGFKEGQVLALNVKGDAVGDADLASLGAEEPTPLVTGLSGPPRRSGKGSQMPEFARAQQKKQPQPRAQARAPTAAAPARTAGAQQTPPASSSGGSLLDLMSTPPAAAAAPPAQPAQQVDFSAFNFVAPPAGAQQPAPAASSDPFAGLVGMAKGGVQGSPSAQQPQQQQDDWGAFTSAPYVL